MPLFEYGFHFGVAVAITHAEIRSPATTIACVPAPRRHWRPHGCHNLAHQLPTFIPLGAKHHEGILGLIDRALFRPDNRSYHRYPLMIEICWLQETVNVSDNAAIGLPVHLRAGGIIESHAGDFQTRAARLIG